jgi:hypothetical protein
VTEETLSSVPSMGEGTFERKRPKKERLSANGSPLATAEPTGFTRHSITSSGSTPRMFAALTVCTLPGSSVRATTVSALTASPTFTSTVPASGSFRSRRTTA